MSTLTSPTSAPPPASGAMSPTSNLFGGGTPTTSTAAPAPFNPSSAFSPYTSQEVELNATATLGNLFASTLGLSPGAHTVGEIMQSFEGLSSYKLSLLQNQLDQAGFYVDQEGNPLPSPTYGSRDSQSFDAMINAALSAAQSRTSVDTLIQNNVSQGVGANLRSNLPQAVTGGGNFYTIDLTDPRSVLGIAEQVFQASLGRNPTQEEIDRAVSMVNSGALAQGYAQQAAHESLSRAQYQTGLNQRNTAYQFETTPKLAAGAIPNGPIANPVEYAVNLLQYMNQGAPSGKGIPLTASNVAFIAGIIDASGNGMAGKNPLGTLLSLPGATPSQPGQPPTYASWAQSIQATAESLMSGPYAYTLAALATGDASGQTTSQNVQQELAKWSNGQFSDVSSEAQAAQKQSAAAIQSLTVTPAQPSPVAQANPQDLRSERMAGAQAGAPVPGATPTPVAPSPSVLPASETSTNPADLNPGQQVSNPTDTYVSPVTSVTTNALTPEQALTYEAQTGANRPAFLGNEFLQAYQAIIDMIHNGGPTVG